MTDPASLALTLLSSASFTAPDPQPFVEIDPATSAFQTPRVSLAFLQGGIQSQLSLDRAESFQAEFSLSAFFSSSSEGAPRSGSQLYVQRLMALRAGKLYTRLPVESFRETWSQAFVQPTYEQWRKLLALESRAVARGQGTRSLSILLGDSLSLWFPANRLPQNQLWLNQGISGDTTWNILSRLSVFANTRPSQVYVMAGVNDLKMGASDAEILWNLQRIVQRLRENHPNAKVIVQSILPTRSAQIPSDRIARINRRLERIAQREGAAYLDLFSRFVDEDGQLIASYTTDGVHLTAAGYAAWQAVVRQTEVRIAQVPKV